MPKVTRICRPIVPKDLFHHGARSLGADLTLAGGAIGAGDPREEELEVVVDLRNRAHRRTGRFDGLACSMAIAGGIPSMRSAFGLSILSRNCLSRD